MVGSIGTRAGTKGSRRFHNDTVLQDEDPCLVSTMTESILPLIPERGPGTGGHASHNNNNNICSKQGGASVGTQVRNLIFSWCCTGGACVQCPAISQIICPRLSR